VSFLPAPIEPVRAGLLTRVTPATRIVVGTSWLLVAVLAAGPVVPAALGVSAALALVFASGLPLERVPARLAPLWLAALGLGLLTLVMYPGNADPAVAALVRLGPLRITGPALVAGVAIALRLVVIALVSLLVFATSDPTRLADSLVQQWHVPYRFAYGTLAALRIVPLLVADWAAIRSVRRLRGIEPHGLRDRVAALGGQLLVLLVAAIRRAERMALAMDARGFDSDRPRGVYRPIRAGSLDLAVLVAGFALAGAVFLAWVW
jgi:energy-coupling factor transport system permease protein